MAARLSNTTEDPQKMLYPKRLRVLFTRWLSASKNTNRRNYFHVALGLSVLAVLAVSLMLRPWVVSIAQEKTAEPNAPSTRDAAIKQSSSDRNDEKIGPISADSRDTQVMEIPSLNSNLQLPSPPTPLVPELVGTDQGSESEPNNTFGTADLLTGTDGRIRASVFSGVTAPAATDPDWFAFTTTVAGSKIYAAVVNSAASQQDSVLEVIGVGGAPVLELDDQDGTFGGSSSSIAGTVLATPGIYYLRVTNSSTTSPIAPYDLYFAVRAPSPTAETEPNNNGTPQVLPASQYVSGVVDPLADSDTFTFTATAGDTVFLSLDLDPERDVTTFNGRVGLGVFGTPGQLLVTGDAGTFDTIDSEAMVMTVDSTGTYTVYVDSQVATAGATQTYNFNVTRIPAAAAGTCTTYTNAVSTPIPDAALTTSTIAIPASSIIRSLRATVDITHPNFPDLDVHLRSPATSNNDNGLFTDIGVSTQTGAQNLNLMDEAALPPLFTNNNGMIYQPEGAYRLHWFKGENTLGTWSLDIRDDSSTVATAGTLNSWSLEVCEEAAPTGTLIYNQDFEASNGSYTHSGTADEWEYGTPATAAQTVTSPFIAPFLNCASGTNCWKTDLDNTYDISSSQDLVSPTLNLTQYAGSIRLYWQQRYQTESISFDRIWVRVTEVGVPANTRMVWHNDNQSMSETNGLGASLANIPASAGWGRYNADISDFAGKNIQVTFHLESDPSINFAGWAIDDVSIRQTGPTRSRADFDGDGRTDLSVFRPSEGNWYLNRSTAGLAVINWGTSTDTLVPGDYDGDLKADTAVFRPNADSSQPDFYILNSNGFTVSGYSWGLPGDVPDVRDYDGDGRDDVAVFRPSNATWYVLKTTGGITVEPFGLTGDIPVAGDFDNDGKANLAVFRPSNNTWYVARATGVPAQNFDAVPYGIAGDKLVQADYDGDNKEDIAVYRPSNGTWYIRNSSNGSTSFIAFGTSTDIPVPGDYDGDGKDDQAVYRNGVWYLNRSTSGFLATPFGLSSDIAIPSEYIP